MNLNEYLIENDRHIGDVVILFSVGAAVDKVSGDTFPLMADNTIGFDEPFNLMDMDISYDSEEWYNTLNNGDKKVVDEVMDNLSYENYVDSSYMNETIFGTAYMVGVDEYVEGKHRVKNINLIDLMDDLGFIPDGKNVNEITDLNVVWYSDNDGDIYITEIYDNDSGEVYWTDPSEDWTDNDDELTSSLLMWGNLENTIGDYYV